MNILLNTISGEDVSFLVKTLRDEPLASIAVFLMGVIIIFGALVLTGKIDLSKLSKKRKQIEEQKDDAELKVTQQRHILLATEMQEIGQMLREKGREEKQIPFDKLKEQMDEADEEILKIQSAMHGHFLVLRKERRGGKEDIVEDRETVHYEVVTWCGLRAGIKKLLTLLKRHNYEDMSDVEFDKASEEGVGLLMREMTEYLNRYWRGSDIPYQEVKDYREEIEKRFSGKKDSEKKMLVLTHVMEFIEEFHKSRTISRDLLYDHNQSILPTIRLHLQEVFKVARRIGIKKKKEMEELLEDVAKLQERMDTIRNSYCKIGGHGEYTKESGLPESEK